MTRSLTRTEGEKGVPASPSVYAIAPAETDVTYLTAGKRYEVRSEDETGFFIVDDVGDEIYCLWGQCAHLDYVDWERVEEPEGSRP